MQYIRRVKSYLPCQRLFMVTLRHCFWTHGIVINFIFTSIGMCCVTFPRMGGVMADMCCANFDMSSSYMGKQLLTTLIQQEAISVCQTLKLIFAVPSAQGGHNLSCKIWSKEHMCTHEHAIMADWQALGGVWNKKFQILFHPYLSQFFK